ncbi:S1/P1 Nuclease [compost metagenome]
MNYIELANILELQHKNDPPMADSAIEDWAEESIKLRTQAYDIGTERPAVLSYTYYRKSLELERQRLWQASQRLAGLLNKSFHCGEATP